MKYMYKRLKQYRNILDLSQDYVAKQLGISSEEIMAIESGKRMIKEDEIVKLSNIYGVTVERIIYDGKDCLSDSKMILEDCSELCYNDKKEVLNLYSLKQRLKRD